MSPATRRRDLTAKPDRYACFGVRTYWNVDPDRRAVEVLELVGDRFQLVAIREDGSLQSCVLPDLIIMLEDVLENIQGIEDHFTLF